jgi:hypothetical protein
MNVSEKVVKPVLEQALKSWNETPRVANCHDLLRNAEELHSSVFLLGGDFIFSDFSQQTNSVVTNLLQQQEFIIKREWNRQSSDFTGFDASHNLQNHPDIQATLDSFPDEKSATNTFSPRAFSRISINGATYKGPSPKSKDDDLEASCKMAQHLTEKYLEENPTVSKEIARKMVGQLLSIMASDYSPITTVTGLATLDPSSSRKLTQELPEEYKNIKPSPGFRFSFDGQNIKCEHTQPLTVKEGDKLISLYMSTRTVTLNPSSDVTQGWDDVIQITRVFPKKQ